MAELAAGHVEGGHARRRAAVGGHPLERRPGFRREHDGPIGAPAAAEAAARVTDRDGRPAGNGHLLQLAVGEEANPLAVGREERTERVGGARHGHRPHRLQPPEQELRGTATRDEVSHETAVRGHGGRRQVGGAEPLAVGQRHGELDREWYGAGRRPREEDHQRCADRDSGCQHGCGSNPRPAGHRRRHTIGRWIGPRVERGGVVEFEAGVAGVALPAPDVLLEATPQQSLHRQRGAVRKRRPVGLALEDRNQDVGRRRTVERTPAGQHLIQHAAEGPEVRPAVQTRATRLLRAHVASGAHHGAAGGRQRRDGCCPGRLVLGFHQSEIEHFRVAAGGDLDVGRLEVAVHQAVLVRGFERRGDSAIRGEARRSASAAARPRRRPASRRRRVPSRCRTRPRTRPARTAWRCGGG